MKTTKNVIDLYYMLRKRLELKKCKQIITNDCSYGTSMQQQINRMVAEIIQTQLMTGLDDLNDFSERKQPQYICQQISKNRKQKSWRYRISKLYQDNELKKHIEKIDQDMDQDDQIIKETVLSQVHLSYLKPPPSEIIFKVQRKKTIQNLNPPVNLTQFSELNQDYDPYSYNSMQIQTVEDRESESRLNFNLYNLDETDEQGSSQNSQIKESANDDPEYGARKRKPIQRKTKVIKKRKKKVKRVIRRISPRQKRKTPGKTNQKNSQDSNLSGKRNTRSCKKQVKLLKKDQTESERDEQEGEEEEVNDKDQDQDQINSQDENEQKSLSQQSQGNQSEVQDNNEVWTIKLDAQIQSFLIPLDR
ncbi:UNKNOWN [Stylonychia lemnae]|uniref:Uncharacterized protein n=1 Tax=Stylonychia lemnae TaxID=5949 RepID=A0A078AUJ2_STYLE|nr:UNKNOWN [Stylonychia lemnae]|eukprot:CDW86070.1 UNKNOWN [Stylonychia lemnae]